VVITPLDGDMGEYLASLRRLQTWTPKLKAIAPAHGHVIADPAAKLDDYISHRLEREAQVLAALQGFGTGGADTAQLVAAIYTDVPEFLWPVARFSVWAHLRKLADEGTVAAVDRDDPDTRWTPSA
jgi:glyoxylase-like metal-dependent hydrolase (beta-lactamase superfamily II)